MIKDLYIKAGGSTPPPSTGTFLVRFFDIDGTILKEERRNAGQDATAPSNPNYDPTYLTFWGWNMAFTNIQRDLDVGAIYDTIDGKTYFFIRLTDTTGLTPAIRLEKATTDLMTIDWGDSTTITTSSSGSVTLTKAAPYSAIGDYIISIDCAGIYNNVLNVNVFNNVVGYQQSLMKAYMGENMRTSRSTFAFCRILQIVSAHKDFVNGILSDRVRSFTNSCAYLIHCNLPTPQIDMSASALFIGCASLKSVSLPDEYTECNQTFMNCTKLKKVTKMMTGGGVGDGQVFRGSAVEEFYFDDALTTMQGYEFHESIGLKKFIAPASLTTMGGFEFRFSKVAETLEFPSGLTSIGARAFQSIANGVIEFVFLSTTPPTIAADTFDATTVQSFTKIYVPDASVAAYKAATNWVTYADNIYAVSTRP